MRVSVIADDMSAVSNCVTFLFAVLLFRPESETANITALISKSPSTSYAVKGQNFTFTWNYTLDGSIGSLKFAIVVDDSSESVIWKILPHGIENIKQEYQERFKASATNIGAELTILGVQRSDEHTYKFNILPIGDGSILVITTLVVNFPPNITEISGTQTVMEGGNITLECQADGKPMPNITWKRLSDNSVVSMALTDIKRKDAGKYKCTADNGIGSPAIGDAWIVVHYPVEAKRSGENKTVFRGVKVTLSCPVDGIPKPNITWYRGVDVSVTPIYNGEKLEAMDTGCYTCVASNSLGEPINITQCLTVASATPKSSPEGPSWTMILGMVLGRLFVVPMTGLGIWWVYKNKKCRKNSERIRFSNRVNGEQVVIT